MGVIGLFRWIQQRFPHIYVAIDKPSRPLFDVLFIDFNCLIYIALSAVPNQDTDDFRALFAELFRLLDEIVRKVKPSTLIYLAVDGVTPNAKIAEQRRRRKNARDVRKMITVGTAFMEELHQATLEFLKEREAKSELWQRPNVVYSSWHTPGEGEDKFFDFVRSMRARRLWNENAVVCLSSVDSDMLLLGMASGLRNFCFMNFETRHSGGKQMLCWGKILIDYLMLEMDCHDETKRENVINDFLTIICLIGNDYISREGFGISHWHLQSIIDIYKDVCVATGRWIMQGDKLDHENAALFLEAVGELIGARTTMCDSSVADAAISALYFSFQNYKTGCPSWTWESAITESLTVVDVARRLRETVGGNGWSFEKGKPLRPVEHSVFIMPPGTTSAIVPEVMQTLLGETDINVFRTKFAELEDQLTKEEKIRNSLLPVFVIRNNRIRELKDVYIDINWNLNFEVVTPPCMPTILSLPVHVVDRERALVLDVKHQESIPKCADAVKGLVNKVVLVDWPYWTPALVVAVASGTTEICCQRKDRLSSMVSESLNNRLVVKVRTLKFASYHEEKLEFSDEVSAYPFEFTKPMMPSILERFRTIPPRAFANDLPVYVIGRGTGSVVGEGLYRITASSRPLCVSMVLARDAKRWMTLDTVANAFVIPPSVIWAVVSGLKTAKNTGDIGLGLAGHAYVWEGIARLTNGGEYVFSQDAVSIIRDYLDSMEKLGSIVRRVSNTTELESAIDQLIDTLTDSRALTLQWWRALDRLRERHFLQRRPASDVMPTKDTLRAIENMLMSNPRTTETTDVRVDDSQVIWPGKPHDSSDIKPGSRVAYVDAGGYVPFGTVGTVVAETDKTDVFYVIADDEVPGAGTMNGRLRTHRGFIADSCDLVRHL